MNVFQALIRTMRPSQWTKNILFVFPALVFGGQLFEIDSLLRVSVCSVLMILASGCVYIMNDIVDVESDRLHPTKKQRPIAAGALSIPIARASALVLALAVLTAAFSFDQRLAILLIAYLLLQAAYSHVLKAYVALDVLVVAAGFVLRIIAGAIVIDVALSPWLTASAGLLALFLVIGKRRQELVLLGDDAENARITLQRYNRAVLDEMLRIVTTAILITYILYTVESPTMIRQGHHLGLFTIPIVIYGLFRYLYLIHVEEVGGAPDEVLLTDRPLQATIVLAALAYFVIVYLV